MATRRARVKERAGHRCEYCHLRESDTDTPHEIDHIRARKHRGGDAIDNLCLACAYCNNAKGPNVAGYDPLTGDLVRLFDPRGDAWTEHFAWEGPILTGLTAIGRATIDVLAINGEVRVAFRQVRSELGLEPDG